MIGDLENETDRDSLLALLATCGERVRPRLNVTLPPTGFALDVPAGAIRFGPEAFARIKAVAAAARQAEEDRYPDHPGDTRQ